MSKLSYLDPISWAFHKNPDLELGERVGVALKEAARYVSIEFDRNFLPKVRLSAEKYGGAFHFSNGLTYNGGVIGWVRSFAPEEEENLLKVNVEYSLDINYEHVSDCNITVSVRAKGADGVYGM